MSQMLRLEQGSTPVVGSSRTTKREPPMKAMEIDSLRFMPPDRVPTRLCLWAYMPVSSKILVKESMKSIKHGVHVNILFLCITTRFLSHSSISYPVGGSEHQEAGGEVQFFALRFRLIIASLVTQKNPPEIVSWCNYGLKLWLNDAIEWKTIFWHNFPKRHKWIKMNNTFKKLVWIMWTWYWKNIFF